MCYGKEKKRLFHDRIIIEEKIEVVVL